MDRISEINVLGSAQRRPSKMARKRLIQAQAQEQKEKGFTALQSLCNLGEYDAAKQLAQKNAEWGYEIIDGTVMERIEDD